MGTEVDNVDDQTITFLTKTKKHSFEFFNDLINFGPTVVVQACNAILIASEPTKLEGAQLSF